MKKSKLLLWGVVNSLAAFLYIVGVAVLMSNAERIFGKINNFWGSAALLLLFVLSALITAALILGRPIWLYLNGLKKEAVRLFIYTVICLFLITIFIFIGLAIKK